MARVILVEDDIDLRCSFADFLGLSGHDVVAVGDAVEFYRALPDGFFDVAVLDLNLPHHDGLSIAGYLSEKTDLAIVLATVRGALADRVRGYRAGADLYLVKPVDCEELAVAIETLARRRRRDRPAEASGTWKLDAPAFVLRGPNARVVLLTQRETILLEKFMEQPGKVVPRTEIYGSRDHPKTDAGSRRLDAAISRLRAKVQAECGAALPLHTVQGVGFMFSGALRAN